MTVLEWLEATTMYSSFTEKNFVKIAWDRGIDPTWDVYNNENITKRERDLMTADLIYTAVLLRPSNTASQSQSHNGFQQNIGSEQDFYQDDKIQYAIRIYNRYGDEKGEDLQELASSKKIKFLRIEDIDRA